MDRFAIPADLRQRRQWVVWRRELRDGKETKVPYRATDPRVRASSTDAHTWASFTHAVAALDCGKCDGIGFVFAAGDPFTGVDLDACAEAGELNAKAAAIVAALDSYTEWSPSGLGAHVIVRARLDGGRCRRGPVELYDQGRYFTVTGARLPGVPHAPLPRQYQLDELRARLFPMRDVSRIPPASSRGFLGDDQELLERMFKARNGGDVERLYRGDTGGYSSRSEADLALVAHLAFWTGGDAARIDALFRASGLMRDKWERADYRQRTIGKALDGG